jgi:hypothetical protein
MNINNVRRGVFAIALSVLANGVATIGTHADEFSFKATNTGDTRITKILVSEDKQTWGFFDIGDGLYPDTTMNLVWAQSTNNEECEQWVKAEFADGEESEPAKFDFCEADLELEF